MRSQLPVVVMLVATILALAAMLATAAGFALDPSALAATTAVADAGPLTPLALP